MLSVKAFFELPARLKYWCLVNDVCCLGFGFVANSFWKMFFHAFSADAVAEVQSAVAHQEMFKWLPCAMGIPDRFAIAAGGDDSTLIVHFAKLLKQGQRPSAKFQKHGCLVSKPLHDFELSFCKGLGNPINHAKGSDPVIDVCFEWKTCIESDMWRFLY